MGLWQIFDKNGVAQGDQFDDGLAFMPGEEGYSTDAVARHAGLLGKGFTFGLIGVPNWHSRIEAEGAAAAEAEEAARAAAAKAAQKLVDDEARRQEEEAAAATRAEAEAELKAMLDPSSAVCAQINAKFDAMLATLPDRAKDIEELRGAALPELDA